MSDQARPSAVVVDTSRSPYARLRPVPLTAVTLTDDFWAPRRWVNREVTLPSQYHLLEETGRIDNFRGAAGKLDVPFQGRYYNDSDVYKWLEAVAWTLATDTDPAFRAEPQGEALVQMAGTVIAEIADAQQPDGYLNTYFTHDRGTERWTNLRDKHELYCAGHLIQAAVAHRRATGDGRLLHVARRLADHICDLFGPQYGRDTACPCPPGHPEIEMALVELARETGEPKYLRQAQFFLDARGRGLIGGRAYHQDHKPFRETERMVGHAVRAVYLNAGVTDLYAETGEAALRQTLDRLWRYMTTRQMYVSGSIGSRYEGEAFGEDYELPNERAYAETCAAIGSVMWNWRLLLLSGDARYADVLETTLYNGVLPGLSLDGGAYFYQNPLADGGRHRRQPWFGCACCPPNVARLLASLPGYFYSLSDEGLWVHLYAQGSARISLPGGRTVGLTQHTRYPWDGEVVIKVEGPALSPSASLGINSVEGAGTFSLWLRIPAWCEEGAALEINGRPFTGLLAPGSYAEVRRVWQPGDVVRLNLPLGVRRVECHPYVAENAGRVALMRGPILYCVEQADNPGLDPRDVVLPADVDFTATFQPDLLGGVVVLCCQTEVVPPDDAWENRLYRTPVPRLEKPRSRSVEVTAIPYYAWANREPGPMQVWLRTR